MLSSTDPGSSDETAKLSGYARSTSGIPVKWTPKHQKRLREVFSFGRPLHLVTLSGIELDLIALGLVVAVDKEHNAFPVVAITAHGIEKLSEIRQQRIVRQDIHNSLASRLAVHLQSKAKITWENIEFTNPLKHLPESKWCQVRPDVYACETTLIAKNAKPEIYEVKVSRADFLSDMAKPNKGAGYADLAEAIYFCTPQDLVQPEEVPDGIGLLWETVPGLFVIKKKAKRRKGFQLHPNMLMTLLVKRAVSPF